MPSREPLSPEGGEYPARIPETKGDLAERQRNEIEQAIEAAVNEWLGLLGILDVVLYPNIHSQHTDGEVPDLATLDDILRHINEMRTQIRDLTSKLG